MSYPFAKMPTLEELHHALAPYGVRMVRRPFQCIQIEGENCEDVVAFERDQNGKQLRAVLDPPNMERLTPGVIRAICRQLDIHPIPLDGFQLG